MSLGGLRIWLERMVEGFVPPALSAESPEDARRARTGVAVAWLMVPVFIILATMHAVFQNGREAVLNAVLAASSAATPFALRRVGRFGPVLNTLLGIAFVAVVTAAIIARGAGMTAATVALAEIPLFATLLGGIKNGAVWAVLATLAGMVIGLLGHLHLIVERVPRETILYDEHSALVVITATLFLIGALYELGKNESLRHIEALENEKRNVERERARIEAEVGVARAERLASMGRLAASAAHEINNPLSYVANNLDFVQRSLSDQAVPLELRDAIVDAQDGVHRIRRIVGDLKALTRAEDERVEPVDAARAMRTALKMAEGHTRSVARVQAFYEPIPPVLADESRLVQVFLNLVINAAQAIEEGHAEENVIAVTIAPFGEDQVSIDVRDTGTGIAPEILDRVVEPFFTTKPVGEGTGLGLSFCDGILRRYGGSLELTSGPDFTSARVLLRAERDRVPEPSSAPVTPTTLEKRMTPLRVLIVDDEPLVARALGRILRGHVITEVGSGREALARIRQGAAFDIVFCDVMMPDTSGMEVYDAILAEKPEFLDRLVFMSGGTFTERARHFRARVKNAFVDKPIDPVRVSGLIAERRERMRGN
jgi:signal transduction histidine kinase